MLKNEIMEKLFGYKLENVGFQSRLIQIMDGILSSEKMYLLIPIVI